MSYPLNDGSNRHSVDEKGQSVKAAVPGNLLLRECRNALRETGLHSGSGVFLDCSLFCGLVDCLVEGRQCSDRLVACFARHEFGDGLYRIFHILFAACIKNIPALCNAVGLLR